MLHAPGSYPRGAIAPAKALFWGAGDSSSSSSGGLADGEGAAEAASPEEAASTLDSIGEAVQMDAGDMACVWLWIHPAGYAEAAEALQACCQQHGVTISER